MALTTCRQCGKQVLLDTAVCTACGVERPGEGGEARSAEAAACAEQEATEKAKAGRREVVLFVAMAFAVVAVVGGILFFGSGDDDVASTETSEDDGRSSEFGAEVACEGFVEDRLKSPSTADFSEQRRVALGNDQYQVQGVVDSENSFGATLRSTWICTVTEQGDRWRLDNLDISERG